MDYEGFKKEVYKLTGINLSFYKEKQMKRRIDSLINKNNYQLYDDYIKVLKTNKELFNEFVNYLTINVSEFYRNPEQWNVLQKDIIPILLERSRDLKIWSAACSTGDEPYTLVMTLNQFMPLSKIKVLATDIDKQAIEKAKEGVYTAKSIENLPKDFVMRHFTRKDDMYEINEDIKKCVEFRQHNLLRDEYPSQNDLIVCRNVLIYFTEEAKTEIYLKFNKALKTNGVLFVGSTEQIIMSNKYCLKPTRTFFYVKDKDI